MKKLAMICTILTIAIMIATAFAMPAVADCGYYAKEGIVTAWETIEETDLRIVTVTDEEGNLWDFFDDEGFYHIGDVVIMRMHDLSDEHDEADEVDDVMLIERLDWKGMLNWFRAKGL